MSNTDLGLQFAEEPRAPEHVNFLLYGAAGAGKSTAAATAPGPLMWLNAEGGGALAYARKTARERGSSLFEVRLPKHTDPRPILDEVYRHIREGRDPQPETVVVDTVGKLRELLIAAMVVPGARNSLQQFGDVAKKLGGFIQELRDLPVNVVLICHEEIKDEDGERIVRPLIGGALTEAVPGEVDVVAYCSPHRDEDNKLQYLGQLVAGRGRRAKDRSGGLGAVRALDLSEWRDAYQAALGGDESDIPFSPDFQPAGDDQETLV